MSQRLPVVNGADLVRVFERTGWKKVRQTGSHVRLERARDHATITSCAVCCNCLQKFFFIEWRETRPVRPAYLPLNGLSRSWRISCIDVLP